MHPTEDFEYLEDGQHGQNVLQSQTSSQFAHDKRLAENERCKLGMIRRREEEKLKQELKRQRDSNRMRVNR